MKIVLTGKMKMTREQESRYFTRMKIEVQKAVSGRTDYLVTGERPGGNKIRDAKVKGIPILTEDEFMDYLLEEFPEYML